MSIADRITSMSNNLSSAYGRIEYLGVDTSSIDKNLQNLSSVLDTVYNEYPKVSDEGISPSLIGSKVGRLSSTLKGNTSQEGTPTPDNPVDINVVKGDNTIKVEGKNLFDISTITENTYIDLEGTTGSSQVTNLSDYIEVKSNTSYTLSYDYSTLLNSNQRNFVYYDENKTYISSLLYLPTNKTNTITTPNNAKYIRFSYDKNCYEIMLNESTTYLINLPVQNLFDKDNANLLTAYINVDTNIINTYGVAGVDFKILYISCSPNTTYTISKISSQRFSVAETQTIPEEGVTVSNKIFNNTGTNITITTSTNAKYLVVFYYLSSADILTEQEIRDSIQIELGDKANRYTPYEVAPIELCKIGDYQDYFYGWVDNWYKYNAVGKVVLNGSENSWALGTTKTNTQVYGLVNAYSNVPKEGNTGFCNRFIINQEGDTEKISFPTNYATLYVAINKSTANTVANFKTWLSTHNTTVYYVLATPTITQITDTTLISQLNALYNAMSYNGQTNVLQTNADLPFIISASALKGG